MLEGIPVTTALAALLARDAAILRRQYVAVVAAGLVITGATTDPYQPVVARADEQLAEVCAAVLELIGEPRAPRLLQAPVSFRVAGPALAHLARATAAVAAAVARAVHGVTDSPAFLEGRFLGTAGFDGFDLAAGLDGLRVALIRLTEISAARLHRLLDPRVTGLSRQLSAQPGLHAGMVTVHKRAVGVTHALPAGPTVLGSIETSLGQEDIQSFSLESAQAARTVLRGATEVLACELLALVQAVRLAADSRLGGAAHRLVELLDQVAATLPSGTQDRPYGRDISAITALLNSEWASS
jgi:histidine ammonia-lyase